MNTERLHWIWRDDWLVKGTFCANTRAWVQIPITHIKVQVWRFTSVSLELGGKCVWDEGGCQRQMDPGAFLASQSSKTVSSRFSERHCLKKRSMLKSNIGKIPNVNLWPPHVCAWGVCIIFPPLAMGGKWKKKAKFMFRCLSEKDSPG